MSARALDLDTAVGWLAEQDPDGWTTGFDVSGWDGAVWLLHAMYEDASLPAEITWEDVGQADIRGWNPNPLTTNGIDGIAGLEAIGWSLDSDPPARGRRLRWAELFDRLGLPTSSISPFSEPDPFGHEWPVSIIPPGEGALDRAQLKVLVGRLVEHTDGGAAAPCVCFYAMLATAAWAPLAVSVPLGEITTLYEDERVIASSPSNISPADRSWLVWTDHDLSATKVQGARALIRALHSDSDLEAVDSPV